MVSDSKFITFLKSGISTELSSARALDLNMHKSEVDDKYKPFD